MAEYNPDWDIFNPALASATAPKPRPGYTTMGTGTPQVTFTSGTTAGMRRSAPSTSTPRETLDRIAAEYMGGRTMVPENLAQKDQLKTAGLKAGYQAAAAEEQRKSALQTLQDQMYTTSGGPNAALIAQYNAQKKQLQENYSQNKADANNLYGQLSSDIETYGAGLQERYTTDIDAMAATQAERQQGLADLQSQRDADRARVAASLGIGAEDVQTPQSSALQEIAGLSSAAASNWESLFNANKLLADASTGRQVAGAKATQADQLMAMKRFLDAQSQAIDSQIAMERMKPVTRELTDVGRELRGAEIAETLRQAQAAFPERFGAGTPATQSDLMSGLETAQQDIYSITGAALSQADLVQMLQNIAAKKSQAKREGDSEATAFTLEEILLNQAMKLRESDLG